MKQTKSARSATPAKARRRARRTVLDFLAWLDAGCHTGAPLHAPK
jgi:hypothetical protein